MKVKVQAKPKSKKESIEALAKYYNRLKSQIKLIKGHKSKVKVFELN